MEFSASDVYDNADDYEHLASIHTARQRMSRPVDMGKLSNADGACFEVDDLDSNDIFDDDYEDDFEDNFLVNASYVADPGRRNERMVEDTNTSQHFKLDMYVCSSFDKLEQSMTSLNEAGTVKKMILRTGNGFVVPDRSKIFFHYAAAVEGSYEPYESSLLRKLPEALDLRKGCMLRGLDLALRSMEVSEISRFIFYPEMAYGKQGCAPRIPKDTKVMFVVEMLQYIDESRLNTPVCMSAEERAALPFDKILETCKQFRTDGNGYYRDQNYWYAVRKYRKGINMLEDYPVTNPDDEASRSEILGTMYANLAQGYLKLERPQQACVACKYGLKLTAGKEQLKLLYRFASAKKMLHDYEGAASLVKEGLALEPTNPDLTALKEEINQQFKKSEGMWRNIFTFPKKTRNQRIGNRNDIRSSTDEKKSVPVTSQVIDKIINVPGKNEVGQDRKEITKEPEVLKAENEFMANFYLDLDEDTPPYVYTPEEMHVSNLSKNVQRPPATFPDDFD